jgi:cell division septum initiation protein DivIVA
MLDLLFGESQYIVAASPWVALAVFSGVAQTIFGLNSASQMRKARNEEARIARKNAARQADRILEEDLPSMMADQRVAVAKSGGVVSGSAFELMMDTARRMTRDAADIRRTGQVQSQYISRQGRIEAQSQTVSTLLGAGQTVLGAVERQQDRAAFRGEI